MVVKCRGSDATISSKWIKKIKSHHWHKHISSKKDQSRQKKVNYLSTRSRKPGFQSPIGTSNNNYIEIKWHSSERLKKIFSLVLIVVLHHWCQLQQQILKSKNLQLSEITSKILVLRFVTTAYWHVLENHLIHILSFSHATVYKFYSPYSFVNYYTKWERQRYKEATTSH